MIKHKKISNLLTILTLIVYVTITFSCGKPTLQDKVDSDIRDFTELRNVILEKDERYESNKTDYSSSKKNYRNLVNILNKSKLYKRVKNYKKKVSKRKLNKRSNLKKHSGISGMGDILTARFLKILKTNKCSNLKERVVMVRSYLIQCLIDELKPGKITIFKYKLTTIEKLKLKSKSCRLNSEILEDKLNIIKSRRCYYDLYKSGQFISPLVIIK